MVGSTFLLRAKAVVCQSTDRLPATQRTPTEDLTDIRQLSRQQQLTGACLSKPTYSVLMKKIQLFIPWWLENRMCSCESAGICPQFCAERARLFTHTSTAAWVALPCRRLGRGFAMLQLDTTAATERRRSRTNLGD